jgi:hypothetical protein
MYLMQKQIFNRYNGKIHIKYIKYIQVFTDSDT